jgi:hypothetical protein
LEFFRGMPFSLERISLVRFDISPYPGVKGTENVVYKLLN